MNGEGTWVRMDDDSTEKYCFDTLYEAWSLAINKHGVAYMKVEPPESTENEQITEKRGTPGEPTFTSGNNKGFDFSTPSGSHEGFNFTAPNFTPGTAGSAEGSNNTNPFVFGSYSQHGSPGTTRKSIRKTNSPVTGDYQIIGKLHFSRE